MTHKLKFICNVHFLKEYSNQGNCSDVDDLKDGTLSNERCIMKDSGVGSGRRISNQALGEGNGREGVFCFVFNISLHDGAQHFAVLRQYVWNFLAHMVNPAMPENMKKTNSKG